MGLTTTCLGAFPKPDYLPFKDWFTRDDGMTSEGGEVTREYSKLMAQMDDEALAPLFERATREAVEAQVNVGIDVPSDGEQRRENYIHYHCRHLEGFDFDQLTHRVLRDGAYETDLPTIRSRIAPRGEHFLTRDFEVAQAFTDRPVKLTVPGPLTITDTTANAYYSDERSLAFDLADALNYEIRALADAGCRFIQVDEPLFARKVDAALDYGVEALERCFDGVSDEVTRVMHMCCGYPNYLDDEEYHKAERDCYFRLADAVDRSSIHQISIEDAHRYNDNALFERFSRSTLIFGAVAIAKSRVEPVEEIVARVRSVLEHIDADRLVLAPDCGLGILGHDLAVEKLRNLCAAAAEC